MKTPSRTAAQQSKLLEIVRAAARRKGPEPDGWALLVRATVIEEAEGLDLPRHAVARAWQRLHARGLVRLVEPGSVRVRVQP